MKQIKRPKNFATTHYPPSKKKVSALKSEILIKYKRIKWTPSCKASLLLLGG